LLINKSRKGLFGSCLPCPAPGPQTWLLPISTHNKIRVVNCLNFCKSKKNLEIRRVPRGTRNFRLTFYAGRLEHRGTRKFLSSDLRGSRRPVFDRKFLYLGIYHPNPYLAIFQHFNSKSTQNQLFSHFHQQN
jgi:hypothetical protein